MRKNASFNLVLGLRDNAHRVDIITPNGMTRPVLGARHPGADDVRAGTIEQASGPLQPVRRPRLASIELELEQRTQTILMHRLPRAVQDRLNGGGSNGTSRLDDHDGTAPLVVAGSEPPQT